LFIFVAGAGLKVFPVSFAAFGYWFAVVCFANDSAVCFVLFAVAGEVVSLRCLFWLLLVWLFA
jgi:hypothetical protein